MDIDLVIVGGDFNCREKLLGLTLESRFAFLVSENTRKFLLRDLAALTNSIYCNSQHGALMNRFPVKMTPIGWREFPTIFWSDHLLNFPRIPLQRLPMVALWNFYQDRKLNSIWKLFVHRIWLDFITWVRKSNGRIDTSKNIILWSDFLWLRLSNAVTDPGFPEGGHQLHGGGCQGPMWQHCTKLVYKNERIWVLGEARASSAPWIRHCNVSNFESMGFQM